jgi:Bacterial membrane protein YfhO
MPALRGMNLGAVAENTRSLRQWLGLHEALVTAGMLACVLVGAYSNVVFFGESLVHSNNLNIVALRATERTHGPNFRPASVWFDRNLLVTAGLHDIGATVTQWETGAISLRRGLDQGELPFWDPYVGGGAPAMSQLLQAFFFPPFLIVIALGNGVLMKNVYFLLLLLMAGWCTWALLRRAGLSWTASFVGGLTFMLSGALSQTVGGFLGQTACCMPAALLATRWFLERASWSAGATLALVYATISLASFPPVLLAVFGLCVFYACAEVLFGGEFLKVPRHVAATRFGCSCILGFGLVAWYYGPAFSLMDVTPQVRNFYRNASSHTPVYASGLLQLLSPTLMGGVPVWANDPIPRLTVAAFNYVGAVPLLLVALVGWRDVRKPLWLVAAAAAIGALGLMFGVTPFGQLRELPGLRNIHFANYYGIPLDFLLALLAAAGFQRLQKGITSMRGWMAVSLVLMAAVVLMLVALTFGVASHPAYPLWREKYIQLVIISFAAATFLFASVPDRISGGRSQFGWGLIAVLIVEGMLNAHFPRPKRWEAWENPPPYVEYLQHNAGLGRVFTMGNALYANAGSAFKIMQLDSLMMFNAPRTYELYLRYAKTSLPLSMRHAEQIPPEPVLDAASISYIVIATDLKEPLADMMARGHERVFDDGLVRIFRRVSLPRYFFTSEFQLTKKRYALAGIGAPHAPREILVESEPPFASRSSVDDDGVVVKVEHFSHNSVRLSLVAPHPGYVYMSESYLPGWSAVVNGTESPIQPANYAFRAVAVPAGPINLELRYVPPGLLPGLGVAAASLLVVVSVLISGARSRAPDLS